LVLVLVFVPPVPPVFVLVLVPLLLLVVLFWLLLVMVMTMPGMPPLAEVGLMTPLLVPSLLPLLPLPLPPLVLVLVLVLVLALLLLAPLLAPPLAEVGLITPLLVPLLVPSLLVPLLMVIVPPVELPPKNPPEKKPPEPPKKPPEPPTMTGKPPLPVLATATGGGGGGANIGGTIIRLTDWAAAGQAVRRTVRRTRRRLLDLYEERRTWLAWPVLAWAARTAGRAGGFSTAWVAPAPMIAPPQVQAQSFAKAIRTDIAAFPVLARTVRKIPSGPRPREQMQMKGLSASALTIFLPELGRIRGWRGASVPEPDSPARQVNGSGKTRTRVGGAFRRRPARFAPRSAESRRALGEVLDFA
jgi:hypothetical protein